MALPATTMRDQAGPSPRRPGDHATSTPDSTDFTPASTCTPGPCTPTSSTPAARTVFEQDLPAAPDAFLDAVEPFRDGLVVGAECMFAWYWLADLCEDERHPLRPRPRPVHEGHPRRQGQDRQDRRRQDRGHAPRRPVPAWPTSTRGPCGRPATCCAAGPSSSASGPSSIAHIQNTNSQYNLPPFPKKLTYAANRTADIAERFADPSTRLSVAADLALIDGYDEQIATLELYLVRHAKVDDPVTFGLLRTVPGIGPVLGLILLYEIHDIAPLPRGRATSSPTAGWCGVPHEMPAR